MPGILKCEMELNRKAIIAIAERKLSRSLTDEERRAIQNIGSLLQLNSICRAFDSPAYGTAGTVLADLERFSKQLHEA